MESPIGGKWFGLVFCEGALSDEFKATTRETCCEGPRILRHAHFPVEVGQQETVDVDVWLGNSGSCLP